MVHFGGHKKRLYFGFLPLFFSLLLLVTGPTQAFADIPHFLRTRMKAANSFFWNPDEDCDAAVEVIGDNLAVKAVPNLEEALPNATISAERGMSWSDGLNALSGGTDANILVWLLGTDDADLSENDINSLHTAVGPNVQVLIMSLYDPKNPDANDLIYGSVERFDNFHILDWASIANSDFYGLFGRLNDEGAEALTNMISSAVEGQKASIQSLCNSRFRNGNCDPLVLDTGESASTIFQFLTSQGYSATAAAAIMGNLYAESHLEPRQLEKISANKDYPGYLVDGGFVAYKNGSKTYSGGFGIAQWTSSGRVEGLQAFADSLGLPVSSLTVQVKYLYKELVDYSLSPATLNGLDLRSATELVLKKYEAPQDQSEMVVSTRTSYANNFTGLTPGESGLCDEVNIANLKSGGFTLSEANSSVMAAYRSISPREVSQNPDLKKYGITSNNCTGSDLENCVSFVKWFVYTYTGTKASNIGNGKDVASRLVSNYGWKPGGHTPQVYAVFSVPKGKTVCADGKLCGHTGVVLGINKERNEIIIGEAGCSMGFSWTGAHSYSLSEYSSSLYTYAYPPQINL